MPSQNVFLNKQDHPGFVWLCKGKDVNRQAHNEADPP